MPFLRRIGSMMPTKEPSKCLPECRTDRNYCLSVVRNTGQAEKPPDCRQRCRTGRKSCRIVGRDAGQAEKPPGLSAETPDRRKSRRSVGRDAGRVEKAAGVSAEMPDRREKPSERRQTAKRSPGVPHEPPGSRCAGIGSRDVFRKRVRLARISFGKLQIPVPLRHLSASGKINLGDE